MGNREQNRRDLSGQRRHFQGIVDAIVLLLKLLLHCYEYCCTVNFYIVINIVAFYFALLLVLLHCYCCIVIVYCCIVIVLIVYCCIVIVYCCIVVVNLQYCTLLLQYCDSGSSQMRECVCGV